MDPNFSAFGQEMLDMLRSNNQQLTDEQIVDLALQTFGPNVQKLLKVLVSQKKPVIMAQQQLQPQHQILQQQSQPLVKSAGTHRTPTQQVSPAQMAPILQQYYALQLYNPMEMIQKIKSSKIPASDASAAISVLQKLKIAIFSSKTKRAMEAELCHVAGRIIRVGVKDADIGDVSVSIDNQLAKDIADDISRRKLEYETPIEVAGQIIVVKAESFKKVLWALTVLSCAQEVPAISGPMRIQKFTAEEENLLMCTKEKIQLIPMQCMLDFLITNLLYSFNVTQYIAQEQAVFDTIRHDCVVLRGEFVKNIQIMVSQVNNRVQLVFQYDQPLTLEDAAFDVCSGRELTDANDLLGTVYEVGVVIATPEEDIVILADKPVLYALIYQFGVLTRFIEKQSICSAAVGPKPRDKSLISAQKQEVQPMEISQSEEQSSPQRRRNDIQKTTTLLPLQVNLMEESTTSQPGRRRVKKRKAPDAAVETPRMLVEQQPVIAPIEQKPTAVQLQPEISLAEQQRMRAPVPDSAMPLYQSANSPMKQQLMTIPEPLLSPKLPPKPADVEPMELEEDVSQLSTARSKLGDTTDEKKKKKKKRSGLLESQKVLQKQEPPKLEQFEVSDIKLAPAQTAQPAVAEKVEVIEHEDVQNEPADKMPTLASAEDYERSEMTKVVVEYWGPQLKEQLSKFLKTTYDTKDGRVQFKVEGTTTAAFITAGRGCRVKQQDFSYNEIGFDDINYVIILKENETLIEIHTKEDNFKQMALGLYLIEKSLVVEE